MSDLLAKCDWDEDELHVYIAEWPEVVYVWVDEKTMPYAPVVADVRSLQAENDKLRKDMEDLESYDQILRDRLRQETELQVKANAENAQLRDQLEEQKCFAEDLERDVMALRELVSDMWPHVRYRSRMCGECELPCDTSDECLLYEPMRQRMRELGVDDD